MEKNLIPAPGNDSGHTSRSLPPSIKHQLEVQFGHDLSGVQFRESHNPTLIGAEAYAQGNEIHFAPGKFQPLEPSGFKLLSHELKHVIQQRQGIVLPAAPPGMIEKHAEASAAEAIE